MDILVPLLLVCGLVLLFRRIREVRLFKEAEEKRKEEETHRAYLAAVAEVQRLAAIPLTQEDIERRNKSFDELNAFLGAYSRAYSPSRRTKSSRVTRKNTSYSVSTDDNDSDSDGGGD